MVRQPIALAAGGLVILGRTACGPGANSGFGGQREMVITTTARLAGAIDSLRWRGQEFINSTGQLFAWEFLRRRRMGNFTLWPLAI